MNMPESKSTLSSDTIAAGRAPCPICEDGSIPAYHPFCSKRCADVDLHRWFSGAYAIPAVETDGYDEDDQH